MAEKHDEAHEAAANAPDEKEKESTRPPDDRIVLQPAATDGDTTAQPVEGPAFSAFSRRTKRFLLLMTAFATFFSPFSSFIYLPAITPIATAYGRSIADINLSVTLYQVMQAVAPLFFGDLSDQIGRRPVYVLTFAIYLGANIGLALQHGYAALLVLRALQSTGSSATVAIGSAVMADFATSADRGGYVTAVQASIMFAPALAPVLGGILTQFLGWRSNFWFLTIAAGVFLLIYVPFVPESARNIVGDGSLPPPALNRSLLAMHMQKKQRQRRQNPDSEATASTEATPPTPPPSSPLPPRKHKIPIPDLLAAVRIAFEKDVGLLLLFMSLFVMANYTLLVPLQDVIRRRYGFNDVQVGLCYIPFAAGSGVGSLVTGRLLNRNYARVAASIGVRPDRKRGDDLRHFPIERARLDVMWPWLLLAVAMTASWGWVVDAGTSLAAPLVVLFFAGAGLSGPMSVLTTLLVDLYPMNPGRVSSTFNLTRAGFSAVGTAVIQYIIDAWGYGYTYLFMGLLVLAASPAILVVRHYGPRWREERYLRFERAKKTQADRVDVDRE
ncbi:major facilitator superfamily transporter [Grosmannia clavigera kw1407]|uniref:Major facilitator superfamily transporter n=1 Tax=Grosmannia clavigera (strain kw1407 / UAMH 11150) TaxID=655863 RepID=F0X746_GROCL|nr:major facilitator superfamily transporter [Grosmannia clavigera kw1407]EFX06329.1 major facilitator superfamily transporter [Grosmannia clavigera kw1407]